MTKDEKIQKLEALVLSQAQQIEALNDKVLYLLDLISKSAVKKDSHNSHQPPSQDKYKPKRNRSLRKKSTNKSGGQKGHTGHTLMQKTNPDEIHDLKSNYCQHCRADISMHTHQLLSKRQVVEIPPIVPKYVEYRQFAYVCSCGHHQKAPYPTNVTAPIQYGGSVIALVSYLNVFQYVPYARLRLLFADIFNLPFSEGSVRNLLSRAATRATPVYQVILEQVEQANYIGSDETGAKVNGKKWWIWVWQNAENTFLKAAPSRGFTTVEETFPEGLPRATIGSDRLAAQLKIKSAAKQLCFPHLLRDLIFLIESEKNEWATKFKQLLKKVLLLRSQIIQRQKAYSPQDQEILNIQKELKQLLAHPILQQQYPKTLTFQKSMIKNQQYLFTCLYDLEVPPDNNASERAVRNVKVKQKISGQFKSGQHHFCVLRSVIDTLQKRKLNVMEYLSLIMNPTT